MRKRASQGFFFETSLFYKRETLSPKVRDSCFLHTSLVPFLGEREKMKRRMRLGKVTEEKGVRTCAEAGAAEPASDDARSAFRSLYIGRFTYPTIWTIDRSNDSPCVWRIQNTLPQSPTPLSQSRPKLRTRREFSTVQRTPRFRRPRPRTPASRRAWPPVDS